ncbi:hypothetical protein NHF46_12755 [Arthrobacter alpinus]|nr:hypothetical protein [Arthrobacter alpinus]
MSIIISAMAVLVAAVVGGAAFLRAGRSNKTAADGLQVAKDSRQLAVSANKIAEDAADAARDSAAEAKRSTDVAVRVEARQTERDHVEWDEIGWDLLNRWTAKNVGIDTAHEAYASVCIDNVWHHSDHVDVPPNEHIQMDFSSEEKIAQMSNGVLSRGMAASGIHFALAKAQRVSYRITWSTASDTWRTEAGGDA